MSESRKFTGVDPLTIFNVLFLFAGAITLGVGIGAWLQWPALIGLALSSAYLLIWAYKYKPYTSPLLIHAGTQAIAVIITACVCSIVT